jgi:2-polyprenyl-3-methyl-5-hydroxy-6-metoxy-1,4-benzoquinol methylase
MAREIPAPGQLTADELRALYNQEYVEKYDQRTDTRVSRLVAYFDLQPDQAVADFACGNGFLLDHIHGRVAEYQGVDFSEPFIISARNRAARLGISNAQFERAEIADFCARNPRRFHRAFTLDFSEHIYDQDFLRIYAAIAGSLKTGGILYLHTPNGEYLLEILKNRGILTQFPDHVAVRTPGRYRELLASAGYQNVEIRFIAHYVSLLSRLHWLGALPGIGKYFRARLLITAQPRETP